MLIYNGLVEVKGFNFVQVVAQSFSIKAGDKLVMHVPEKFSLAVLGQSVFLFVPPERPVHVENSVVGVHANVFSKVGDTLFRVPDCSSEVHVDDSRFLPHFGSVGFMDDLASDKKMGIRLVGRGQPDTTRVSAMKGGNTEGIDKLAFVDLVTSPTGSLVEGFPVLGEEQSFKNQNHLATYKLLIQ